MTSQLETLVPTIHTFPAPGYCAIYQDSLLGTLSQVKGIDSDNQQAESSAFLAQAMLYHLDISIICMVYRVDKCAFPPLLWGHISIGSLSVCAPVSPFPSLPSARLVSIAGLCRTFFSLQNVATRLLPLGNSTDNQENAFQHDEVS